MTLFSNKNNLNTSPVDQSTNTTNDIPRDGGFGQKGLNNFEQNEGSTGARHNHGNLNNTGSKDPTFDNNVSSNRGTYDSNDQYANTNASRNPGTGMSGNRMGGNGMGDRDFTQTGQAGGGYNDQYQEPMGGPQGGNNGGGGGFISDSHAQRLYRDAETSRTNNVGPGSNNNSTSLNNNNNNTSPTTPQNSQALATQAEQKARESEAMKKQAAEIAKAEELEKAAMAARTKAVDHGAHPLHGQPGGYTANARGSQA
jgi:hypothetical protein